MPVLSGLTDTGQVHPQTNSSQPRVGAPQMRFGGGTLEARLKVSARTWRENAWGEAHGDSQALTRQVEVASPWDDTEEFRF